jgi:hypothetical protein
MSRSRGMPRRVAPSWSKARTDVWILICLSRGGYPVVFLCFLFRTRARLKVQAQGSAFASVPASWITHARIDRGSVSAAGPRSGQQ